MIKKIFDPAGLILSIPAAIIMYLFTIGELPDNDTYSILLLGSLFIFGLPWSIPTALLGTIAVFAIPSEWWGIYLWYALIGIFIILSNLNGGIIIRYLYQSAKNEKLSPFVVLPFVALGCIVLLIILSV